MYMYHIDSESEIVVMDELWTMAARRGYDLRLAAVAGGDKFTV